MSSRPTILIIEDNPDHREIFSDILHSKYDLEFSETEQDIIGLITGKSISLVVLDYFLQNKYTGLELLKKINKQDPFLPVIVITAYGDEDIAAGAIKAGAAEYIRKTPDNNFGKKIKQKIKELLDHHEVFTSQERTAMITFFTEHINQFLKIWKEKIIFYKERINSPADVVVKDELFHSLFKAFLDDLQRETATETLNFLKKMIWQRNTPISSLLLVELLNTSFKEAARELLTQKFPHAFDGRSRFMQRIGTLVDENDLMLSREYEKIVTESTTQMLQAERINTKLLLMRTLQHEIRQPLSFIYNSAEVLLADTEAAAVHKTIEEILDHAKKIDGLLSELEKDSEAPLKNYSDKLPMYDLSQDKG
ncbi:MAG: response regulator [Spirochaetales bacterium]|nr:response regulator [Spirochaetales bacterium]